MAGQFPGVLHTVAVLLGVSLATFAVAHATGHRAQPVIVQYALFLRHALQGDFGQSLIYRQPVALLVLQHLPATLLLTATAFTIALTVGIPLGVIAAARGGLAAWLLHLMSMLGPALPAFWLGLMLVLVVSVRPGLLPADGTGGLSHLMLPAIALSLHGMARLSRLVASGMRNVLGSDYIRAARAKGLSEGRVIWVHGLRNVLVPVLTMAGLELTDLLSSAVVVEVVFAWPGIGRLAATALSQRDIPLLQGIVLLAGLGAVLTNLLANTICARIDPRPAA